MYEDIIGKKFNELEVLEYVGSKRSKWRSNHYFLCKCSCGVETTVERMNLVSNHTKSCGCLRSKAFSESKSWQGFGEISGRYWTHLKRHARSRRLAFDILIEEAWTLYQEQKGLCALTGWNITLKAKKSNLSGRTASLDRINSEIGYVMGNVQWVHKDINSLKSNFPEERFIELCLAVSEHRGNYDYYARQDQGSVNRWCCGGCTRHAS